MDGIGKKVCQSKLKKSLIKLSSSYEFDLKKNSIKDNIRDYMLFFGLGIDCSGLVYNVLDFAFREAGLDGILENHLKCRNNSKRGVYRAGAFVFASSSIKIINPGEARELDLILKKSKKNNKYTHVALILRRQKDLFVCQSTLQLAPVGLHIDKLVVEENNFHIDGQYILSDEWNNLYKDKRLEFRRLSFV